LSSNQIEINDRLIVQSDLSIEAGYNAARRLFNRAAPSAIVAIDDLTAIGALQYCNDQHIGVPDQVSITGFDDISLAQFVSPRLTTIAQPMKEMAACATRQLINEINSRNCEHKEYLFEPEIILRESTNLNGKDIHPIP
jgi:DNA-binding LacI/PurR family transcriptional regulator